LVQVFQNLISNAIKYRGRRPLRIHISAERKETDWVFSVKDNGIGIADEHTGRIFEIFHRIRERSRYTGTGIGLSTCKKIIELHGGHIWVKSEKGKGSTFFFTIPDRVHDHREMG
jgi:signal transduction histidine kinase